MKISLPNFWRNCGSCKWPFLLQFLSPIWDWWHLHSTSQRYCMCLEEKSVSRPHPIPPPSVLGVVLDEAFPHAQWRYLTPHPQTEGSCSVWRQGLTISHHPWLLYLHVHYIYLFFWLSRNFHQCLQYFHCHCHSMYIQLCLHPDTHIQYTVHARSG